MSSPPSNDSSQMGDVDEARFPDIGEVFEEKYRIEGLLGKGGYAKVYRATQVELDRDVAIKVLSPSVQNVEASQSNTGSVESLAIRFEREAKLVSQLRSPYTVTMYDYGRTDTDLLYMVLEYIDGITLDDAEFPMEPGRIAKILRQVLKSLHEAHDRELLHRDLKPANIMLYEHLGEKDQVKLLDFGIAKLIGETTADRARNEADLTGDATLLGTPRYMAPEQIRGNDVGPSRDIYSLGLIAYEMLVGRKAITEDDSIKIMAKHISAEPLQVPPGEYDPELSKIINRMLAKDVDDRYSDVQEAIGDLKRYERGNEIQTVYDPAEVEVEELPGEAVTPVDEELDYETSDGSRVGLFLAVVISVLVLAGVGTVAFLQFQGDGSGGLEVVSTGSSDEATSAGTDRETPADDQQAPAAGTADAGSDTASTADVGGDVDAGAGVRITSKPEGAAISVGDREIGAAPVEFDFESIDYPATVTATHDGDEREKELDGPPEDEEIAFDFDDDARAGSGRAGGYDPEPESYGTGSSDDDEPTGSHEPETTARPSEPEPEPDPEPEPEGSEPSPSPGSGGSDEGGAESSDESDDSKDDGPTYLPLE